MKIATGLITFALAMAAAVAVACNSGSVRDAALHAKRDVHRLCLFANKNDEQAKQVYAGLERWLQGEAKNLNVKLERVDADAVGIEWKSYGIPSAPPKMPVVALVGEFPSPHRAFVIDHWEPALSDGDLAALRTSPTREAIKSAVVDKWAAIVYSPAADGGSKQPVLDAVVQNWNATQPPGVTLVRLDRQDARERLLCAFAGINASGPDWVGVVFGRGKLMAPPLQADEITEASLNQLLERLPVPCTCLQQLISYGLDIPLDWEPALDLQIAAADQNQGYFEQTLGPPAPVKPAVAALIEEIPKEDKHVVATSLAALAAATGVVLLSIVVIVLRTRRRNLNGF